MVIWISPKNGNEKHYCRVKVNKHYGDRVSNNFFSITVEDNPQVIGDTGDILSNDINKIKEFILLNKVNLIKLCNDEISPFEYINSFIKV